MIGHWKPVKTVAGSSFMRGSKFTSEAATKHTVSQCHCKKGLAWPDSLIATLRLLREKMMLQLGTKRSQSQEFFFATYGKP